MKALIAALLMMGPFATELDLEQARKVYARALYDCGIWIAGDVMGRDDPSRVVLRTQKDGNISNMTIGKHEISAICLDDGVTNLAITGNHFR